MNPLADCYVIHHTNPFHHTSFFLDSFLQLSKLIIFELFDFMDTPEDFVERAMMASGCGLIASTELQNLELVLDAIQYCSALEGFFGEGRYQKLGKYQAILNNSL